MQDFIKAIVAKVPLLTFVLSAVVAYLLIPITGSFPMVPFFILFTGLSTLVYLVKKERDWLDTVLYFGILLLSSFLLIRANELIQFLDLLFIFVFGSILILPPDRQHTLPNLLFTPFYLINKALTGKNIFPFSWAFLKKLNKVSYLRGVLPSLLITLLFLGITIPLLASANPFFNQLIQNVLNFFNLSFLERFFNSEQLAIFFLRLIILVFFVYTLPRALTASREGVKINETNISLPVNYLIPKVAMGILLVVFFITQAQLYFATPEVLWSMGYTNSRLTNEIFFQVTIVAFIIFFLAYLDKERKTWSKRLTYFLILEAFFLVGIAFKSVFDYSFLYGFTEKRLWGYATMFWLTGALLIFVYYYAKQIPLLKFFQLIIAYTIIVLLGVNIVNFDYLISHYSKTRLQSGTDYVYMAKLSPDGSYYKETLNNLVTQIEESNIREQEKINSTYWLLIKIERLKQKYNGKTPLNSFNFSEYSEYNNVRDIDTGTYRKRLLDVEQKYNQLEQVNPQQQSFERIER